MEVCSPLTGTYEIHLSKPVTSEKDFVSMAPTLSLEEAGHSGEEDEAPKQGLVGNLGEHELETAAESRGSHGVQAGQTLDKGVHCHQAGLRDPHVRGDQAVIGQETILSGIGQGDEGRVGGGEGAGRAL
jgi:hypothetical protein